MPWTPINMGRPFVPVTKYKHTHEYEDLPTFSYGSLHWSTPAETTITTVNVAVKAAGTTWLVTNPPANDFTEPADNRLTYGGRYRKIFRVTSNFSVTAAGNNKKLGFNIAKNTTLLTQSHIDRYVSTGADEGAVAISALTWMENGDYIELWVENESDATNLTIESGNLIVTEVG